MIYASLVMHRDAPFDCILSKPSVVRLYLSSLGIRTKSPSDHYIELQ